MAAEDAPLLQSAVIPFRPASSAGLEILLIRRVAKDRWGIPKGWIEPGQSALDAAKAEAIEEAGAAGEMSPAAVAQFTYRKRGRDRLVHVFLLRVIHLIDDFAERDQRVRSWLPLESAAEHVHLPAVAQLIREVPRYVRVGPGGRVAFVRAAGP